MSIVYFVIVFILYSVCLVYKVCFVFYMLTAST